MLSRAPTPRPRSFLSVVAINAATMLVGLEKSGAALVLRKLDRRMQERGLRILDLFMEMDVDRDGKLSGEELRAALEKHLQPPPDVQASMKLRQLRQERRERFIQQKELETQAIHARMEEAEKSGASVLIKALEARMRELMCRTVDLFRAIDTTGDGECDLDELCAIMDFIDLDVSREEVERTMAFLDRGNANGTVDADELETAVRHYRRTRWEKHIVAVAQKAALVAMLDKGVLDRREAKALVKYLTCGFQVKHVPLEFFQRALDANLDRKLNSEAEEPEPERRRGEVQCLGEWEGTRGVGGCGAEDEGAAYGYSLSLQLIHCGCHGVQSMAPCSY